MAYSHDLRMRIVRAIERGEQSQREIAEDLEMSVTRVERIWRRYRETGQVRIKTWRHGRAQRLAGEGEKRLETILAGKPDTRLDELCAQVKDKNGRAVSLSTMSRQLKRLGIKRKKSNLMRLSKTPHG